MLHMSRKQWCTIHSDQSYSRVSHPNVTHGRPCVTPGCNKRADSRPCVTLGCETRPAVCYTQCDTQLEFCYDWIVHVEGVIIYLLYIYIYMSRKQLCTIVHFEGVIMYLLYMSRKQLCTIIHVEGAIMYLYYICQEGKDAQLYMFNGNNVPVKLYMSRR